MMDAQLKAKWVEALRSGEYKQGTGFLHQDDRYCCLGVLCDLVDPNRWKDADTKDGVFDFDHSRGFLPADLRAELGIPSGFEHEVAAMNDEEKKFSEIADYIEANL